METIKITKEQLEEVVREIVAGLREPLFRGLGGKAEDDYERLGMLVPYEGNMSVGEGVFFTNDLEYALGLTENRLIVTAREILDPEAAAVDTRKPGYDREVKERLDRELGEGNYTGMRLWREIQRRDTITYEGGPKTTYVFTRRNPVTRDRIIAEIVLLN